ncbi:hypothetical protein LTR53_009529 [Teratosphaeriaceae sp. CCFEE 6253]|nr:hypothetical protein LTR53_009529 [Teratosphaeriaceae sp. CCFEE 6253]
MLLVRSSLFALLSAPFVVFAQSPNPPNVPVGFAVTAGQSIDLSWKPTTQGTVTLVLRSGASSDLNVGSVIVSSIDNSGSYTWTPDSTITRGSDYTIEIVDDSDPTQTNFYPYFVINSDNTVASSTGQVTLGAAAATSGLSTATPTGSATSILAAISSASVSSASASASSASASTGSSASAATVTATTSVPATSSGAATGSSAASGSQTTMATGTSSSASAASSAAASGSSAAASPLSASVAGAPRATAMAGMLGLAALGALAL